MAITPHPRRLASGQTVWRVSFRVKPGANTTSETFDTFEGAKHFAMLVDKFGGAAARQMRDAIDNPAFDSSTVTLNDLLEAHLVAVESFAKEGAASKYRSMWDNYVGEQMGALPAEALTRPMVEQWIARLRKQETRVSLSRRRRDPDALPDYLSAKTIKNAHGLLSTVLTRGMQEGKVSRNVAKGVALPRGQKKVQPVFLTNQQFLAIWEEIDDDYKAFVNFLAGTGTRWGEATALTGTDFNIGNGLDTVSVTKAWSEGEGGKPYLDTTKTSMSVRTITLPKNTVELVAPLVSRARSGLVFTGREGGQLRRPWFLEAVWYPALTRADIGVRPRIHDLRHSHSSWLIQQGVALPVIQRRLGHESIKTTIDVYGHLAPDAYAGAADAADLALAPVRMLEA